MADEPYECEFTPLARAFAEAKASTAEVEATVRAELIEYEIDPRRMVFHTVFIGGGDYATATAFICTWTGTKVLIDTASYDEGPALKEGLFKGMKVMFPAGDSEEL